MTMQRYNRLPGVQSPFGPFGTCFFEKSCKLLIISGFENIMIACIRKPGRGNAANVTIYIHKQHRLSWWNKA